jgi:hypothetical protein
VQRRGSSGTTEVEDVRRPRLADVNKADAQGLRELRFKVGDALPADDPLARFILVVSMGPNDNSLSNTRFVNTEEPYELLYFFRLASGHLHELANRLRRAHDEWPEVQEFVAGLQEDYRDDFASIVRLADPNDDLGQKLERLRNEFFHYPDLRRKTAERGKLPLMQALTDAAGTDGIISLGEESLGGIRAHFADELVGKLVMERLGLDDNEGKALVGQLGELQAAYGRFAQAALGRYLNSLGEAVVTQVHGE